MEERLKREVSPPANADIARLLREGNAALERDNARAALPPRNQAVVVAPRDPNAWRLLARAAKALNPRDWRERYEMQERAVSAAYLAYQRSRNNRRCGDAFLLLGEVFEWREMWRPALTAYRLSNETEPKAEVRDAYETLRESRGFRLTNNEVDADSANPRACCFTFSEPLARAAWISRLSWPSQAVAISRGEAEDSQLCVQGLRHGERYGIVLRAGIPSTIPGENLLKNADYDIYVRDRKPSARGSGRAYVLPKTGQQGIPVVSVNTTQLGVKVLRIGDRNLINAVREGGFLMMRSSLQDARDHRENRPAGLVGHDGGAQRTQQGRDHRLPRAGGRGELKPGVYLLVARPGEFREATSADGDGGEDYEALATQWFVVSDLGLTAFFGGDGLTVLMRSLADAAPVANAEVKLIAKNNEISRHGAHKCAGRREVRGGPLARHGRFAARPRDGGNRGRLRLPRPQPDRLRPHGSRREGPHRAGGP